MSTKYVLECPKCRKKHYVQSSQAGTSIACKCRRTINVPSMRHLRDLPVASDQTTAKSGGSRSGWGFRQAFALVSLLVGIAATALAIYLFASKPDDPAELAERRYASEEKQLDAYREQMTVADSFELWANLENTGINLKVPAEFVALRERYGVFRFRFILSLIVSALSFAFAAVFWFLARKSNTATQSRT